MEPSVGVSQLQNVSQQLNLAPQLLQWLKLLQVSTVELAQLVQHELETNPTLELDISRNSDAPASPADDDASHDAQGEEKDPLSASLSFEKNDVAMRIDALRGIDNECNEGRSDAGWAASSREDQDRHQYVMDSLVAPTSLFEHLSRQLAVARMNDEERRLAEIVVGSLDLRGYIDSSLGEIAEQAGCSTDLVEKVLAVVRQLDPPGIAARDLRDCLLRQVDRGKDPVAFAVLHDCFDLLSTGNTEEIARVLKVDPESVGKALATIGQLNPTPGLDITRTPTEYVTPDVIVHKRDGKYVVELNDEFVPSLRVTDDCRKMLAGTTGLCPADLSYLRRKMRSASFLIQGIAQRQATLYKVACEIVRVQQSFLDREEAEIGCLTMGRVARVVGVHETTVSRAISGKYMRTPRGIFPMRAFFEAGYSCADGSALTPNQVRKVIAGIVADEAPGKHTTDICISEILEKKGLKVARRTVAKYRQELCIPSSKDRIFLSPRRRSISAPCPAPEPELAATG